MAVHEKRTYTLRPAQAWDYLIVDIVLDWGAGDESNAAHAELRQLETRENVLNSEDLAGLADMFATAAVRLKRLGG